MLDVGRVPDDNSQLVWLGLAKRYVHWVRDGITGVLLKDVHPHPNLTLARA